MTNATRQLTDSLDILIGELVTDDELRGAFLRDPEKTLEFADDWALPLTDSELQSLREAPYSMWERVTEELALRMWAAA